MKRSKYTPLTTEQKVTAVRALACFDSPKEVAEALKTEFGVSITPQGVESYDPTKRAGQRLAQKWKDLFEDTRKRFLAEAENHIPIANKTVRLREMQKAYQAYKGRGNWVGAMRVLEQVAKEMGNVHTNRRELTGREGRPIGIDYSQMTDAQIDARLAELLGRAGVDVVNDADEDSGNLH